MALKTTTPADAEIKANEREAARMYERGVAAARGGQRRVAAVLLARAVQLDPRHEGGWLWLSGVLDAPDEIAFCLRSALAINPQNERALQGLAWLERRELIAQAAVPASQPLPASAEPQPAANGAHAPPGVAVRLLGVARAIPAAIGRATAREDESHAVYHGQSWWVNWRRSHRAMGRARVVLLSVPILLLALTLALNSVLRDAVERNATLTSAQAVRLAATTVPPQPTLAPADVLQPSLAPERDAQVLAYLSAVETPRAQLRNAVQSYRNATSRPGGSSSVHAAAARRLRDEVEAALQMIERLTPPPALVQAHDNYLAGLAYERAALDAMLDFYGSFRVELANRAAIQMEDAGARLDRATDAFARAQAAIPAAQPNPQSAR